MLTRPGSGKIASMPMILVLIVFALIIGVFYIYISGIDPRNDRAVSTYEECVAAGYPIRETYPPQCSTPDGQLFSEDIGNEMEVHEEIRVSVPRPNQVVSSPLTVTGEAIGTWLFESNTDFILYDLDGNVIATGLITAEGDWMTEDFVPFSGTAEFESPEDNKRGRLVINKSNPSGLEEHSGKLEIPIFFE